eukprot:m.97030 g.97030  ORF g.97030 m.97030 type:complete len:94 (+) comp8650_c0_seq4:30-311(+)
MAFLALDRDVRRAADELGSFDGRRQPDRCARLVSALQEKQAALLACVKSTMEALECYSPRMSYMKFSLHLQRELESNMLHMALMQAGRDHPSG